MNRTLVLDSWAILEWIHGRQPARDLVRTLLEEAEAGERRLLISALNVGEVYYFLRKKGLGALAQSWRDSTPALPVTIAVPDMEDIWKAAALKGRFAIAYADAFAAALAQKHQCPLVTGDLEFQCVDGLQVHWLERP